MYVSGGDCAGAVSRSTIFRQWRYRDPSFLPAAPVGLSDGRCLTELP
jgi:hypothetical protein